MRRVLRYILRGLIGVVAVVGVLGALFAYLAYSTAPEMPQLSGILTRGTMTVGGLTRTYRTYVPRGLAKGAPLVLVMHGAGENGARMRIETGYGFEILADQHGFAVVYPNAYEGYWDVCNIVGEALFWGEGDFATVMDTTLSAANTAAFLSVNSVNSQLFPGAALLDRFGSLRPQSPEVLVEKLHVSIA
jgi:hypothetical protein